MLLLSNERRADSLLFSGYTGANPNDNPICNKKLTAKCEYNVDCRGKSALAKTSFADNGKSVGVTVTDRCQACGSGDLDFSPAAFMQLAPESVGRITNVKWSFD